MGETMSDRTCLVRCYRTHGRRKDQHGRLQQLRSVASGRRATTGLTCLSNLHARSVADLGTATWSHVDGQYGRHEVGDRGAEEGMMRKWRIQVVAMETRRLPESAFCHQPSARSADFFKSRPFPLGSCSLLCMQAVYICLCLSVTPAWCLTSYDFSCYCIHQLEC